MTLRIELHRDGIRDLLKSPEVRQDLERRGWAIAAAAGEGYEIESTVGPNRARVEIRTATTDARITEATNHTLIGALDAGRG